jgi:hypothetical protein
VVLPRSPPSVVTREGSRRDGTRRDVGVPRWEPGSRGAGEVFTDPGRVSAPSARSLYPLRTLGIQCGAGSNWPLLR